MRIGANADLSIDIPQTLKLQGDEGSVVANAEQARNTLQVRSDEGLKTVCVVDGQAGAEGLDVGESDGARGRGGDGEGAGDGIASRERGGVCLGADFDGVGAWFLPY